jgi:hypothetical protein
MNSTTKSLVAIIGLFTTSAICNAQVTNDAAAEFSTTNNPSGVWTYGYMSSSGVFTKFSTSGGSLTGVFGWSRPLAFPDNLPAVIKNLSGQIYVDSGNVFQIGQLALHPGNSADAAYAVLRFTAPATGLYTITARFSGLYTLGTTSDAAVQVNGAGFFYGQVRGYGPGSELSYGSPFALTLADGDTVDFIVTNGGNGFGGDFTGLAATVTMLRPGSRALIYPAVEIGFATESNKTYKVQWSPVVQASNWQDLGSCILGDGAMKYLFDSTRGHTARFYRIVETNCVPGM